MNTSRIEPLETRIAPAFAPVFDLATLSGANGFAILSGEPGDYAGGSVSSAGDVNGDGFDDAIIGAYYSRVNGTESGASYVVFGKAGGVPPTLSLASLDGTNGFQIIGASPHDYSGLRVSGAGDVNGDGFDDVIIGSNPEEDFSAAYVVFGHAGPFAPTLNLASLDGANGFKIRSASASERVGLRVSGAGDVNGDGFGDMLVGASAAIPRDEYDSSRAFVIFGKASAFTDTLFVESLDGSSGFAIETDTPYDHSVRTVGAAGDVNGDGFDDVLVGAPYAGSVSFRGIGYVIFGKACGFSASVRTATLDGSNGFKIEGEAASDHFAQALVAAGDVNGDGFGDLLFGAPSADANGADSGASYVLFGKSGGFTATFDLATLDGTNGFKISGEAANDRLGRSVSGAGDVNGDGVDDLIVSSLIAASGGDGSAYVVFGKTDGFAAALDLANLDGVNGFRIRGGVGSSVSGAGDLNGDGFADLLIGDAYDGTTYVVFGTAGPAPIFVNATTATFTDVDGDRVTVRVSTGSLDAANFSLATEGLGARLIRLNLGDNGAEFAGANVTITARRTAAGGDGHVNIGFIDAAGVDLGRVGIDGDLRKIDAGDADVATRGLARLTVRSMGFDAEVRGEPHGQSTINGALGTFAVTGAMFHSDLRIEGGPDADLARATIAGRIVGGGIAVTGDLGELSISRRVIDATFFFPSAGSVTIGGSARGTFIQAFSMDRFAIVGDFTDSNLEVGHLPLATFGGDILDAHFSLDAAGSIVVRGSVLDSFFGHESLGAITAVAGKAKLTGGLVIDGDLVGTEVVSFGVLARIRVGGDVTNSDISARGKFGATDDIAALAIGAITIGGSVEHTTILAGYDYADPAMRDPVNADASIGQVSIGSHWRASDLVAGVVAGGDGIFGTDDDSNDFRFPDGAIIARIAGITIGGQVVGTAGGADGFGFVAGEIVSFSTGKTLISLTRGPENDLAPIVVGFTGDTRIREVGDIVNRGGD